MNRSSYWYVRLLTGHQRSPWATGLASFAALLLALMLWVVVFEWQVRGVDVPLSRLIFEVLLIAVASYAVGITAHSVTTARRDVLALASALTLDEAQLRGAAESITQQSNAIHVWTLFWFVTMAGLTWWAPRMPFGDSATAQELAQPTIAGWTFFRNVVYGFALGQLAWIEISLARGLGQLLKHHGRVNLLDRSALRPLATRTRRNVLIWIPLLAHSIVFAGVVLAVVILPGLGMRQRYIDERNRQLEKVRARIAERSAAVIGEGISSESSSLPELVSWEQRLQKVSAWPYEMTIYLRVLLYGAIGLASWVGAALVERMIGIFFG